MEHNAPCVFIYTAHVNFLNHWAFQKRSMCHVHRSCLGLHVLDNSSLHFFGASLAALQPFSINICCIKHFNIFSWRSWLSFWHWVLLNVVKKSSVLMKGHLLEQKRYLYSFKYRSHYWYANYKQCTGQFLFCLKIHALFNIFGVDSDLQMRMFWGDESYRTMRGHSVFFWELLTSYLLKLTV